jgi:hypothetical protein
MFSIPDVHVRTLSTGEIHPLTNADGPIYSFAREFVHLQIYDDLLMLVTNSLEHHVLVFNWKTGGQVAKIVGFLSMIVEGRIHLPYPSRPSHTSNALSSTELTSSFHTISGILMIDSAKYAFGL